MNKLLLVFLLIASLTSCGRICPKMYTTFDKGYGRIGSFYSSDDLKIGSDTVIEGRKVQIVKAN